MRPIVVWVYLPQGKKSKRLNEEPAVGIIGRTVSSALIDSVYSMYSAGSSGNSAAAICRFTYHTKRNQRD
ncbi:hypothetical protein KY284_035885 [Solanum tuberosum]|nr:hypothetical protein KY284_035885 [Solanum tuberosum]